MLMMLLNASCKAQSAKISDSGLSLTKWRGMQNKQLKAFNCQFHKVTESLDSSDHHDVCDNDADGRCLSSIDHEHE